MYKMYLYLKKRFRLDPLNKKILNKNDKSSI